MQNFLVSMMQLHRVSFTKALSAIITSSCIFFHWVSFSGLIVPSALALSGIRPPTAETVDRRSFVFKSSTAVVSLGNLNEPVCAMESNGLASKMSKRDAALLKNSAFNIPPSVQKYPEFMRGEWQVQGSFRGFLFPSKSITKDQIITKTDVPGFQKCSIAQTCDVGKELVSYKMVINQNGMEDRKQNYKSVIEGNLGYSAVNKVVYDGDTGGNPNRISIAFEPNKTRNAERIELFCNARESELITKVSEEDGVERRIFVCSEYMRQVTFSLSNEFGVARQIVGNYAHFWTWREQADSNTLLGNLLTAAYLDPNDPLFFNEPAKPIAVFSQDVKARRI